MQTPHRMTPVGWQLQAIQAFLLWSKVSFFHCGLNIVFSPLFWPKHAAVHGAVHLLRKPFCNVSKHLFVEHRNTIHIYIFQSCSLVKGMPHESCNDLWLTGLCVSKQGHPAACRNYKAHGLSYESDT